MILNKFEYIGTSFIVQSYLKNDFANICEVDGDNFRIDFSKGDISTSAKESKSWVAKKNKIVISEIKMILNQLFYEC